MLTLTKRQKQIYDFIKKYINRKGYSPTFEEIKKHFKLSALSTIHQHIETLIEKGILSKNIHSARGIVINKEDPMIKVPLLGTISAGKPIGVVEEKELIAVPKSKLPRDGNVYALRVIGNSMIEENINNGDTLLIKSQPTAMNGEKVVALLNNEEATLKKFYKEKDHIRLQPANKTFDPIIITKKQGFMIQGIVIDIIKNDNNFDAPIKSTVKKSIEQYKELPLNKIICGDAVEELQKIPDNSIDLMITSPPYDSIRDYNGNYTFDLSATGKEVYRTLKEGGIAIMVIQDQTKNFGKTLTSFRTIMDWCDNIGFKLFENIIYKKHGAEGAWWTKRFRVDHEYMPVFLKGARPQFFSKEHLKIPSKHGGKTMTGCATRLTNGKTLKSKQVKINPLKCRGTLWDYTTCGDGSRLKHKHPATFPNKIPYDFIKCFCPEGGVVLDPFIGSGTTAVAAKNLGRKYIGIDIEKSYCDIAEKRIEEEGINNNQEELFPK